MTYICPICHIQLNQGEEHPTLIECVRALVGFVNQLDTDIETVSGAATTAQETAISATDLAYGLDSRVEQLERDSE